MLKNVFLYLLTGTYILTASGCYGCKVRSSTPMTDEAESTSEELHASVQSTTYWVKGNPRKMLEPTQPNPTSFIRTSNLEDFQGWSFRAVYNFAERAEVPQQRNLRQAELDSVEPRYQRRRPSFFRFSYIEEKNQYHYQSSDEDFPLVFIFSPATDDQERLELQAIQSREDVANLELIHYSLSDDKQAMSFLFFEKMGRNKAPEGEVLTEIIFHKNFSDRDVTRIHSPRYPFYFGPGAKIRWPQQRKITLRYCDMPDHSLNFMFKKAFTQAVSTWNDLLQDRLQIEGEIVQDYPPFSDLNYHCVYPLEDYQFSPTPSSTWTAMNTLTLPNSTNATIISSDVFIPLASWTYQIAHSQLTPNQWQQSATETMIHELAHVLGLGHVTDTSVESIMRYTSDASTPTLYDIEMIEALYPLQTPPNQLTSIPGDSGDSI